MTDVSHQSLVFGTLHGRSFKESPVVFDRELPPFIECHLQQFFFGLQFWGSVGLSKSVPWTSLLASVATVEAVAHCRLCFLAKFSLVLDRLVRKATLSIELSRLKQCVRGTSVDTTTADAAAVGHGIVGRKFDIKEELTQKEHASCMGNDELMVLANPSEPRFHSPIPFQHWSAVDEYTIVW